MSGAALESGPKESRFGQLLGVHVAMLTLATVTVFARLLVRLTITKSGFGGDDVMIMISLALTIAFVTINLCQTKYGLGQHEYDLPPTTNFSVSQELFYFGEMLYYITVGTTKIAILTLYLRIIPTKTYRYLIYGTMTFVALTVFSCVMANVFQCTPIDAAWDTKKKGTCINRVGLYLSNAGLDIFQDLFIYVLPIKVLYQLNIPKKQRIALIAIFVVGGFVVVTGILRLNSLKTAAVTKDPTWHNVASANWSVVEMCVGIFCASLVHFRPLLSHLAPSLLDPNRNSPVYIPSFRNKGPKNARSKYVRTDLSLELEHISQSDSTRQLHV